MNVIDKQMFSEQFLNELYEFCASRGVHIECPYPGKTVLLKDNEEIALISLRKDRFESICVLPLCDDES